MADERGGYRRPNNPAPVSGPGKLSQRTDGGPGETMKQAQRYISGMPYGEAGELNSIAGAAPLSAGISPEQLSAASFDAPTAFPEIPIGSREAEEPMEVAEAETPDAVAAFLRETYRQFPSPYLKILIDKLNQQGR